MASMSPVNTAVGPSAAASNGGSMSPPAAVVPKNVAFELLFPDSPQRRARLPLRVHIFPHDATDSIVTTVKNFYGLYSGPTSSKGVSFEDQHGNTLIARYENFHDQMVVYVRVTEESPPPPMAFTHPPFQTSPPVDQPFYMEDRFAPEAAPQYSQGIARPESASSRRRSTTPDLSRGRRSTSIGANGKKSRSRSARNHTGEQGHASDAMNGYSSGDGASDSLSGRSKEQLGNTDISVENIVEGGRRKRAKFESSELPLFAPPQMPAATSNPSVSPARRIDHHRPSLPFVYPGQNPFINPRPMQSPHSYTGVAQSAMYATPSHDSRRSRGSIGYMGSGPGGHGVGVLPTPDPTVGSCMSEEDKDVAIQLMRLGEPSHASHGRTSTSTADDTFSGKADVSSSTGATSDSESDSDSDLPPTRRQRLDEAGASGQVYPSTEIPLVPSTGFATSAGEPAPEAPDRSMKPPKLKAPSKPRTSTAPKAPKSTSKVSNGNKPKKVSAPQPLEAMSPVSLPPSRKQSISSTSALQPGEDDHPDLSSKPRCQRCRKSKKGCDRQRPCSRCRDAGLSADQCISEDEGNGRKGRYGRHMGVPIKKEEIPAFQPQPSLLPAAPIAPAIAAPAMIADKSKKRKR